MYMPPEDLFIFDACGWGLIGSEGLFQGLIELNQIYYTKSFSKPFTFIVKLNSLNIRLSLSLNLHYPL